MYKTITDPYTEISYTINTKKGSDILKNYLNYSMKGGTGVSETTEKAPSPTSDSDAGCWKIAVDPDTKRSYWWNTKTKETRWHNTDNIDTVGTTPGENWECSCNTENCNCTNTSIEIDGPCVKISKKYALVVAELSTVRTRNEYLKEAAVRLSNEISALETSSSD